MLEDNQNKICVGPRPAAKPRKLVVPEGAWDCHAHVIGTPPAYPYSESRHYNPYPVTPEDFLATLDAEGFRHGVAVQVSVHGTDNSYLLKALQKYPERLKGVAVIDRSTPDRVLAELKAAGVVGIRLLEASGGVGTTDLEALDARCAELSWHIQLCVPGIRYPELLPRLLKMRSPLVVDHMGWFDVTQGVTGPGFQAVLHVMRTMDAWLKTSGGFRLSRQDAPYLDTVPFMQALLDAVPDRLVWGSDWPHVNIVDLAKMPQYGDLLDLIAEATDDGTLIRKLLIDNPLSLYGGKRA